MVLRGESGRHVLAAGVHPDDIICENVVKMGVIAQSTVSNGVSTMLANLGSSFSVDISEESSLPSVVGSGELNGCDSLATGVVEPESSGRSWMGEYYAGAAKEMYLIRLSKVCECMTLRFWYGFCKLLLTACFPCGVYGDRSTQD